MITYEKNFVLNVVLRVRSNFTLERFTDESAIERVKSALNFDDTVFATETTKITICPDTLDTLAETLKTLKATIEKLQEELIENRKNPSVRI